MSTAVLSTGSTVSIRKLAAGDLETVSQFEYSVSITEPHSDPSRLAEIHNESGMWLEIGYIVHNPDDRRKGYAAQALRLFSDLLFIDRTNFFRHQLIIEVWNTASWKMAERCGFVREGILRSCGFGDGDPADCFVYSRTLKDYSQATASTNGPG